MSARMHGEVQYPPNAESAPIRKLAADLKQMAAGLDQGVSKLTSTATTANANWVGMAAQAFIDQMNKRAATIDEIAQMIASAATPLQTFAAAIDSTSTAYDAAVAWEWAAKCSVWLEWQVPLAIAAETAAVTALQAAGVACATALATIEAKVAAGERQLHAMNTPKGSTTPQTTPAPQTTTPSTAVTPKTETAATDWNHLIEEVVHAVEHGLHVAEPVLEGSIDGLKHALEHNTQTYVRNGRTFQRWAANQGGPRLGLTATEATAVANGTWARWAQRLPAVGVALAGVSQTMEDNRNAQLTTTQRVGRTSAAVLLEGGGAVAGAEMGAAAGATAGATVGAFFGGVGAVPGAVVGGAVGALGGAIALSSAGRAAKEWLFNWNPQGAFK